MFITENENKDLTASELYDISRYQTLIEELNSSNLNPELVKFFKLAATRFIDLNYYDIAQYYYNLTDDSATEWFKKLNLVIVDDNDAIENGYIKLTKGLVDNLSKYIKEK